MQSLQPRSRISSKVTVTQEVLNWLLEENEPSSRYETLTGLLEKKINDPNVMATWNQIGRTGWAANIFAKQKNETYWDNAESCVAPKFTASAWQLIVLGDLNVSSKEVRVKNAVEHFWKLHNVESGGVSLFPKGHAKFEPHICMTGNIVRALSHMGYSNDDRVLKSLEWLVSKQLPDGGWNCYPPGKHGSIMNVQPLWALSEMMMHDARPGWENSAKKGIEFLLKHHIFKSDRDDSVILYDFLRLHYPLHYAYDFLHGLRILSELGIRHDPRMNDAVSLLLEKRTSDGRWLLEGVYRGWRRSHGVHEEGSVYRPEEREVVTVGWGPERALQLEEAGKPSKWITLQALLVLKRLGLLDLPSA